MRKTSWLLCFVFSLLFLAGCMTSKKAVIIRTKLAVETEEQLKITASEVQQLIEFTMSEKANQAFEKHSQKYQNLINSIRYRYGNDLSLLTVKSAKAGADYVRGEYRIKEQLLTETERLYMMVYKIKVGAKAINVINEMADKEITIHDDLIDQIVESGLDASLETLFQEIETKYTPKELGILIPKLDEKHTDLSTVNEGGQ